MRRITRIAIARELTMMRSKQDDGTRATGFARSLVPRFLALPKLVRLWVLNAVAGMWLGLIFAFSLVLTDAHGLGALVAGDPAGYVAFAALAFVLGLTFGSAMAGSAVMLLGRRDDDDDDHGPGWPEQSRKGSLRLARVSVTASRRH
jgi:hypothetical protein